MPNFEIDELRKELRKLKSGSASKNQSRSNWKSPDRSTFCYYHDTNRPSTSHGLCNASQTFQRFMDQIFRDMDNVIVYIDDICIASQNSDEHYQHVKEVFSRLRQHELRINASKCIFGQQQVDFLGYHITQSGITPTNDRIQALIDFKKPTLAHELKSFLAMLNVYRRCLPNAAFKQGQLQKLIIGNKKKDKTPIVWNAEADQMFEQCKSDLAHITTLTHPSVNAKLVLHVDASNFCVGAASNELRNGSLGFFSKRISESQKKQSTYDRELLAIFLSVKYFTHMIEGRSCTILTDHKPLTFAFQQNPEKSTPKQTRQLSFISEYTTVIQHISGKDNILKQIQLGDLETSLYCDISSRRIRSYVTHGYRKQVFNSIHSLSHRGKRATVKLITERFVWKDMKRDIAQMHDDPVKAPLKAPYDGPYLVVSRNDKNFVIDINGKHNTVTIDRVKAAHIEADDLITPSS
ncbi:hypothetical protein ACLKA7_001831 [Drosophila subpalustris]